ncbi:MAG TPA: helix-turn-helix domain-containing protein [Bellilinea sp.]|nr:helix-turn-helix domain-containing protein [Bellilinea sp.]
MGHWLPHAFRADGSFIFTFEEAVFYLVNRLYPGLPEPASPQSQGTPKQIDRNAEIRALYAQGMSVPELAKRYGISKNRVYQVLRGKRK